MHIQKQWIKYITRHDCFTVESALQPALAEGWELHTIFAHPWRDVYDSQPDVPRQVWVDEHAHRPKYNALWVTAFMTRKDAP